MNNTSKYIKTNLKVEEFINSGNENIKEIQNFYLCTKMKKLITTYQSKKIIKVLKILKDNG